MASDDAERCTTSATATNDNRNGDKKRYKRHEKKKTPNEPEKTGKMVVRYISIAVLVIVSHNPKGFLRCVMQKASNGVSKHTHL